MRAELALDIKTMTEATLTRCSEHEKFGIDIKKYYQQDKKKKRGNKIVGKD